MCSRHPGNVLAGRREKGWVDNWHACQELSLALVLELTVQGPTSRPPSCQVRAARWHHRAPPHPPPTGVMLLFLSFISQRQLYTRLNTPAYHLRDTATMRSHLDPSELGTKQ
jgi:hypothetical protein